VGEREDRKKRLKLVQGGGGKGAKIICIYCRKPIRWYPCPWCRKGGKGS